MDAVAAAAALQRAPLLTIPEMRTSLDKNRHVHGMYSWWLVDGDELANVPPTPHPTEPAGLLYVGIGPGSPRSLKRTLRDRFIDHTTKNTGGSTFRLVLASFLFEPNGWRPYWSDRPLLTKADNLALSAWQAQHLCGRWVEACEPWRCEAAVVRSMRPPLNRDHNQSHPFYAEVGKSRARFRAAARQNGPEPPASP